MQRNPLINPLARRIESTETKDALTHHQDVDRIQPLPNLSARRDDLFEQGGIGTEDDLVCRFRVFREGGDHSISGCLSAREDDDPCSTCSRWYREDGGLLDVPCVASA